MTDRPTYCAHHERTRAVGMIEYVNLTGHYRLSGLCRKCLPGAKTNPILAHHGHIVHEYPGSNGSTSMTRYRLL